MLCVYAYREEFVTLYIPPITVKSLHVEEIAAPAEMEVLPRKALIIQTGCELASSKMHELAYLNKRLTE